MCRFWFYDDLRQDPGYDDGVFDCKERGEKWNRGYYVEY